MVLLIRRTVHDKLTGRDHVLTSEELQLIQRLKKGSFYSSSIDPHEVSKHGLWFSIEVRKMTQVVLKT